MANLYEQVGTCDYNDIFAGTEVTPHAVTIQLTESQGVLARGTLVSGTPGGEMTVVSAAITTTVASTSATTPAVYVIADEVDTGTTDAVTATAYDRGFFRREALVTSSYTLTAADYQALRVQGIYTNDSID